MTPQKLDKDMDFAHVADLLRQYANTSEPDLRAVLSNNLNVILAALDRASRPTTAGLVERRKFPILSGGSIDWQLVEDHARQAKRNHSQTVQRLAERGGLSWNELYDVLHDQGFGTNNLDTFDATLECRALEARYLAAIALPAPVAEAEGKPDPARALVKKAATALRPLAGLGSINMWRLGTMEDAQVVAEFDGTFVTAGDIRRARATLQSIKDADHAD